MNHNITLTEEAYNNALRMSSEFDSKTLRVYLEGKGCDGFYYGVSFDNIESDDLINQQGNLTLVIDPESYKFCQGSIVDWVDDERGQGFLVENPNHQKFRGKFYKRTSWQERLLK